MAASRDRRAESAMAPVLAELRHRLLERASFCKTGKGGLVDFGGFSRHYSQMRPQDVSWLEVCEYSEGRPVFARYGAALVVLLIDEGLYSGEYAEPLGLYRDALDRAVSHVHAMGAFMCGRMVELFSDEETVGFIMRVFSERPFSGICDLSEVDTEMLIVMRGVCSRLFGDGDLSKDSAASFRRFFRRYAGLRPSEVSWNVVCESGRGGKWGRWPRSYDLALTVELLDAGMLEGPCRDALVRLRDGIVAEVEDGSGGAGAAGGLLCGDAVKSMVYLPRNRASDREGRLVFARIGVGSRFLTDAIAGFLQSDGVYANHQTKGRIDVLVRSFGAAADEIDGIECFTASLFWRQAEFIRGECRGNRKLAARHARFLRGFYLYLVDANTGHDFFERSASLSDELLRSSSLTAYVANGTYVTSFYPGIDLGDRKSVALILRGYDHLSTQLRAEGHVLIDVSGLDSSLYRREVLAYCCSTAARAAACTGSSYSALTGCLRLLLEMKSCRRHPNPDPARVSREELFLLREAVDRQPGELATKICKLTALSSFLQWEGESRGAIEVEEYAIDHLRGSPRQRGGDADPIPDDELSAIAARLAEGAQEGAFGKVVFAIFCLAVETEFRISHICNMTVDCVRPSVKPGEYVVHAATKTSGGERESCLITESTRRTIADVVDATDEIRSECETGERGRYVFLVRDRFGFPMVIRSTRFSEELKRCCEEIGLERRYTAANLRDTHMTKAVEYAIRNGRPDLEVSVLSRHKHRRTTMGYVELDLEKMLESTYGIVIGDGVVADARGRVVDRVPEESRSTEFVVEGGCGHCTAASCAIASPLPCFVCKNFVTTVDHEPFFIRAIEAVEAQIVSAGTRHDADDLVTVKTLLVMFLQAIYEKKEARDE